MDPKTAEALSNFVKTVVNDPVEKAVRSLGIEAQSRPQEASQAPASKISIGWTRVGALFAAVGLMLGAFYWPNDSIRSEIGSVRSEISDLRSDMREDFASIRAEVAGFRERMNHFEILIQDRPPAAQ